MANNINNNPYILDTAEDDVVASTMKLHPKCVVYSDAAAAGDTAQIEDGNEVVKCVLTAAGEGDTVPFYFPPGFVMHGLSVGTLTSGKVYLYF